MYAVMTKGNLILIGLLLLNIFNLIALISDLASGSNHFYYYTLSWMIPVAILFFLKNLQGHKVLKLILVVMSVMHLFIMLLLFGEM